MERTLFERLGGRTGISAIVDTTVDNHMKNPAVNPRFLPLKEQPERLRIIKDHTIDFFSMGSGGPANYTGLDMVAAHTGMNISPGEYFHVMDDIMLALDANGIDEDAKKDVLSVLWSLKGMIVSK
ncbi:group I truncated hemoglobin [Flagellimonas sp.]|jgi:hemoglobin|uniref:group I truncated hemoglobin n=1 Tax=Flagellimonas sp. TaxID=2058762 RepID=UPI000B62DE92|nr:MAG: group 1 truncated hemoglobin [Muricauda sp. TMED12]|tara:strand:- start:30299 stop:30673 length:375 start_codon:yes stop_codon:yes gene_type:complete